MKAVMLMFDSLNREMLEPYGCDWVKTPNFRRLAEHSVCFDQCYAGSLPCMPARRELQTGRYNMLHTSWGPMEPFDDSMPELLKNNNIYTHLISDHVHYWEDGGATYHYRYNSWENIRGQEGDMWKCLPELFAPCDESKLQNKDGVYFHATQNLQRHDAVNRKFMKTEEDTALAKTIHGGLEFIDTNHDCDRWFLQIECFDPHEPFYVPKDWKTEYEDDYENPGKDWPPYHHVTEEESLARHYRYKYAELLELCDKYLGKLLDKFDELDLWKDTMLIVNTDHGYLLGEHGWWSKVVMPCYDEIAHIPLFIHDPRFAADGQRRKEIVQTIDLPATVLEFFNVGSHILLRSGMDDMYLYSKNSGNAIRYDKTLENMSGDRTFDYLTSIIYACDGDWCYGPHHAITLQYMAKDYGFSGKYKAMIDSMETDANLFLACFKVKDF